MKFAKPNEGKGVTAFCDAVARVSVVGKVSVALVDGPVLSKQKKGKNMAHHCVKLIGSVYYHFSSRFVLGKFQLEDKKSFSR